MSWARAVSDLRREVRALVEHAVAHIFIWTFTAKSSEMGDEDEIETGDGENSERSVQRIEPWGLRTRSVKKMRSLGLRLGSSNVFFLGIKPSKGYGPTDLEEGEVALYCSVEGTEIRLDSDGNITIDAASGKDIILNGGTAKVARVGDATAGHQHAAGSLIAGPYSVTGTTATATDDIAEGANNVKA